MRCCYDIDKSEKATPPPLEKVQSTAAKKEGKKKQKNNKKHQEVSIKQEPENKESKTGLLLPQHLQTLPTLRNLNDLNDDDVDASSSTSMSKLVVFNAKEKIENGVASTSLQYHYIRLGHDLEQLTKIRVPTVIGDNDEDNNDDDDDSNRAGAALQHSFRRVLLALQPLPRGRPRKNPCLQPFEKWPCETCTNCTDKFGKFLGCITCCQHAAVTRLNRRKALFQLVTVHEIMGILLTTRGGKNKHQPHEPQPTPPPLPRLLNWDGAATTMSQKNQPIVKDKAKNEVELKQVQVKVEKKKNKKKKALKKKSRRYEDDDDDYDQLSSSSSDSDADDDDESPPPPFVPPTTDIVPISTINDVLTVDENPTQYMEYLNEAQLVNTINGCKSYLASTSCYDDVEWRRRNCECGTVVKSEASIALKNTAADNRIVSNGGTKRKIPYTQIPKTIQCRWNKALAIRTNRPYNGPCAKMFRKPASMELHLKSHTNERRYRCDFPGCGKKFPAKNTKDKHNKTHYKEARYPCKFCPQTFTANSSVLRHIRTEHEGTNGLKHACKYHNNPTIRCQSRFARTDAARAHEAFHTPDLPFVCRWCNKAFSSQELLTDHVITSQPCSEQKRTSQRGRKKGSKNKKGRKADHLKRLLLSTGADGSNDQDASKSYTCSLIVFCLITVMV